MSAIPLPDWPWRAWAGAFLATGAAQYGLWIGACRRARRNQHPPGMTTFAPDRQPGGRQTPEVKR